MKKSLALLLALIMAAGLVAVPAGAAEGDGFVFLDSHWEWDEGNDRDVFVLDGIRDGNINDMISNHAGRRDVILLKKAGSPISSKNGLKYVSSRDGVSVQFIAPGETGFVDTFDGGRSAALEFRGGDINGVIAVIDFHEWGAKGEIKSGNDTLVSLECKENMFDFYDAPDAQYPINDWCFKGPGDAVYLRNNWENQIVQNTLHIDVNGIDGRAFNGPEFGTINIDGNDREYIKLSFNDSIYNDGNIHVNFDIWHENGGVTWFGHEDLDIYVMNEEPRLVWVDADWNEKGEPELHRAWWDGDSQLYRGIPQDYLGNEPIKLAVAFYNGEDRYDPNNYEMLDVNDLTSSDPEKLEVIDILGLLMLVPYEYENYSISYRNGGDGLIYSMPVSVFPAPVLAVQSSNGTPGGTVAVPLRVSSQDLEFNNLDIVLYYNPEELQCTGVASGLLDSVGNLVVKITNEEGKVGITWGNKSNIVAEAGREAEPLTVVTFKVADGWTGETHVHIDRGDPGRNDGHYCCDENENDVSLVLEDGVIRVYEGQAGDLNLDSAVTTDDALALLRWFAGYDDGAPMIQGEMWYHMDVNRDGRVNLNDVTRLLQYVAGWPVEIYY